MTRTICSNLQHCTYMSNPDSSLLVVANIYAHVYSCTIPGNLCLQPVCNVWFWFTLTVDLMSAWNRHWYPTWCILVANQGSRICPLPLRKQTREAIIMLDVDIPHRAWHPPFQLTHNRVCIYNLWLVAAHTTPRRPTVIWRTCVCNQ